MTKKSNFSIFCMLLLIIASYSVNISVISHENSPGIPSTPKKSYPKTASSPTDTDGDGLPDFWETQYGNLHPNDDNDQDGLTNIEEFQYCPELDPLSLDTDEDGLPDGWEIEQNLNPLPFVTTPSLEWGTDTNPRLNIFTDLSTGNCGPSVESYQLHEDCLILTDPIGESPENRWKVNDFYSGRSEGKIEFYYSTSDALKHNAFYIMDEGSLNCITLSMDNSTINHYVDDTHNFIMDLYPDVWYHILIEFDCSSDWHIWINGESMDGEIGYPFRGHPTYMNEILFLGDLNANNYEVRYDKIGFSWETEDANDANADPDHDGDSNLEEYLDNTDPHQNEEMEILIVVLVILGIAGIGISIAVVRKRKISILTNIPETAYTYSENFATNELKEEKNPSVYCTHCGSKNEGYAIFCSECGEKI